MGTRILERWPASSTCSSGETTRPGVLAAMPAHEPVDHQPGCEPSGPRPAPGCVIGDDPDDQ
jgi:hypothetical protein